MLVLKRKNGNWVEISMTREKLRELYEKGEEPMLRFRVYNIVAGKNGPARVDIAFDDAERNFEIQRPERITMYAKGLPENVF